MESKKSQYTVGELLELRNNNMLIVNAEYQRGAVWTLDQKKKLIDSIFRGYPIPIIYLHKIEKSVGRHKRDDLEIIDGQQRLDAIHGYREGAFPLYDPGVDLDRAKFPAYLKNIPCDWGGKFFQDLSKEKQEEFEQQILTVAEIKTTDPNEVKDLFVRLQAGSALNAQERRDAWPGNFTHFILRVGGKPAITRYPGHRFFPEVLKMKPRLDRGKTRQLAAQMYVLFDIWRSSDGCRLCDISAEPLNKFYYDHLMFDEKSPLAKDFWQLLTKLATVIPVEKLSRLKGHDAIHALLLADTLSRHYEATWDKKFGRALATFLSGLANGKKAASEGNYSEYWSEYGQWTNTSAADGDKILKRHMFYQRKMLEAMSPILPKDPNRGFGEIERSVLFYRQNRICQVCDQEINFDDLEVHHVKPHAQGGPTEIENGAIVHPQCHPKSESAVEAFAAKWLEKKTIRERNTFEH